MRAPNGDNATTRDLTSSLGCVVLTASSQHSVGSGLGDRTGTQATDSGDSGDIDARPPDCECLTDYSGDDPLACFACFLAGFDDPNPDVDSDDGDGDADLSANRFDIDADADAAELEADQYAERVARQWGTPDGEWWP